MISQSEQTTHAGFVMIVEKNDRNEPDFSLVGYRLRQEETVGVHVRRMALIVVLACAGSARAQGNIEVSTRDAEGHAIPNVAVVLRSEESTTIVSAASDALGKAQFPGAAAGRYVVSADANGYFSASFELVLRARQVLSLEIELQKKSSLLQQVEVPIRYLTVDPDKTGSSYFFTRQDLEQLPDPNIESTNDLVNNLLPGASDSHDNFLAVRGTEFSLHEAINGVSFLDNTQPQFSAGVSPQIFETVDLMTGGFTAEYGNRFGGVLDITTRSGKDLNGHGSVIFRGATLDNYDVNADYGGDAGKFGYYFFVDGFTSGRYLDPPEPVELYDFGKGSRAAAQFDWSPTNTDTVRLLLMGSGTNFQQPNITEDQVAGRDAQRHLRQQTAILTWQHTFSPRLLLSSSIYERTPSDRVLPTTDPVTPLSDASRAAFTLGAKSDISYATGGHLIKAGGEFVHLREGESFFLDSRGDPEVFPPFQGWGQGKAGNFYTQDHFSVFKNVIVDLGLRYDHFDLVSDNNEVSPRVGVAYHIRRTGSLIHASYNRLFSPPPVEYSLLASFLGNTAIDPDQRVGNVRAYTQNYGEIGLSQELYPRVSLEINGYAHNGRNSFENHEISISRIFVPINFDRAKSRGFEMVLNMRRIEKFGLSARLQYALARTTFYGPVTGGFAGDEPLDPGERITPAFDQTHTGTAQLIYNNSWHGFWAASAMRYGSGTIVEHGPRLPQHFTSDLALGLNLWNADTRRVGVEFNATNVGNSVYKIAKESDEIPIQYAPWRTIGASLRFNF